MLVGHDVVPQPVYRLGSLAHTLLYILIILFVIPGGCYEFARGPYANQGHTPCPASGIPPLAPLSGARDNA